MRVMSFGPVASDNARVLVLGTMPGVASLRAGEYYAHPRNAFWPIMAAVGGAHPADAYAERLQALQRLGIALWDVLAACERPGSLDAAIVTTSEAPNDIPGLLAAHPAIALICLNGLKAAQLFRRHAWGCLPSDRRQRLAVETLPSSSPAYTLPLEDKIARWRACIAPCLDDRAAAP